MPLLQIHLLGDFLMLADDGPVTGLHQARLQSLLAYLLLHRHAPQSRQQLAFLFWPDSTETQAQTNLRKALHHLRRVLPGVALYLQNDARTVHWALDAPLTLDVAEFESKLEQAHAAGQQGNVAEGTKLLTEAVTLYQGEFMRGCYDDWILAERERLHQRCLAALEQLMAWLEEAREYPAAIRYGQRLLALDPVHEATYRRLMRLYALHGDRAGALRIYHTCADVLQCELGVEPSTDTQELYIRLLQQETLTPHLVRRPQRAGSTRLVGREVEWRRLQGAWRVATGVRAYFALVAGEAGIGKTRLVEELRDWAAQQGVTTAHARAYAAEGGLAYAPVIDWLRGEPFQAALAQLEPVWRSEVARLLPELLVQDPSLSRPEPLTERWQRQRLFEALTRVILLAKSPLLLALDDLQWCDAETLEWLHFLLRKIGGQQEAGQTQAHLMVTGTVRSEEVGAEHPLKALLLDLRRSGQVTEIELGPLAAADTATLARQVAERELDGDTVRRLSETSEGNPLFVVEMVRAARWGLEPEGRKNSTNSQTIGSGSLALPPKVQAVIQFRLEQLSQPARELARLAAVIGRSFTFDVLAQATDTDEDALVQGLDELWQRRIVREQGGDAYDFSHDRIREVVYEEVSPIRRRLLHHRTAQALAFIHANDIETISGQLGFHYERALQREEAVKYYRQAATASAELYAFESALFYLNRMLTLLEEFPSTVERTQHQIEIWLETAGILIITKGWTVVERRHALDRASELARRIGNEDLLFGALAGLYGYYGNVGDWYTCRNVSQELLLLAEKLQDPRRMGRACITEADRCLHWGEFQSSLKYSRRALEIEGEVGPIDQARSAWHSRMAETLWSCGYPEQAQSLISETIRKIDEQKHPFARVHGREFAMYVHQRIGHSLIVRQLAAENTELCERFGFSNYALSSRLLAGWAMVQLGAVEEGLHQISQSLSALDQIGDRFYRPYFLALLAEAQEKGSRAVDALNTLAQAIEVVEVSGDRAWEAELYRLTGDFRFRLDPTDAEVEPLYKSALTIAQRQGARSLELRAATSLVRLWQSQGKSTEAHALLAPIYGWFTEGFDTPDLQAAKTLLDELHTQASS